MSRNPLPFHCDDISALARSLGTQLAGRENRPGHVELLNMLARSGGYRNFQHFRAQWTARESLDSPPPPPAAAEPVDFVRLRRLLRLFDEQGRLIRRPGKYGQQTTCLWAIWSRLTAGEVLSEIEINERLRQFHLFEDPAWLRRRMCDDGLMCRTRDGREYRRVEQRPPADALALIQALSRREEAWS